MKVFFIALSLLMITSCKTTAEKDTQKTETAMSSKENCPENGECTVEVTENAAMTIADDTATGGFYPVMEAGDKTIVTYTYSKKGPEGTVDGNYSETIQFELPEVSNTMSLTGVDLQQVNMLFGKQCYCKGEAGYYKVTDGMLTLEKKNDGLMMTLEFKVPEVSEQRVTTINRMISR